MKVSLNWVKEFLDFNLPPVDELVEKIGAQLGAVEEVTDLGAKYQGIVVAKVVTCEKHTDADKLSVCIIDDGGVTKDAKRDNNGHIQIVCGAPNVRAGLTVAWLPPGTTVPATFDKEPLVLEARDIRGVVSNGMLASAKELALGDSHEGILELDEGKPGDNFAKLFQLDDYIIAIENKMFTHRPDCFGILGIAREIAGILGQPFKSPEWYKLDAALPEPTNRDLNLSVRNELPGLVPRFVAVGMSGVTVSPSPVKLQSCLTRLGVRPINNVVDLTNYIMLLTGQPLHAYDYDKVKNLGGGTAQIVVRNPKPGEKLLLLNGKEIEPRLEAIMIATDAHLLGVGGVMGGAGSEVDANTKNIILECANFDMYSVRRTGMAHGLFTDAVTRFNKGQSPLQNAAVAAWAMTQLADLTGGQVSGTVIDDNHVDQAALARGSLHPPVQVPTNFVNQRLGLTLAATDMQRLLQNVECMVDIAAEDLTVASPFWRTDIELREDVVEEVGRLHGFDKLPLELPKRDLTPASKDSLLELENTVRNSLAKAGANEVLTYSFVHGNLFDKVGQDKSLAFQLSNALSPDLQYYRLSLTPSLLDKVHPNIKAGYDEFALFEIGKVHGTSEVDEAGLPKELGRVGLVYAADAKAAAGHGGAAYYQARKLLTNLLADFGLTNQKFVPLSQADFGPHKLMTQMLAVYEPARAAVVYDGERIVGVVGEYRSNVRRALKLPDFCAGFELFISTLLKAETPLTYVPLPRFPKVTQDITLKVPAALSYQELYNFAWDELGKSQPENTLPTLGPVGIYQSEDDNSHKNISLRLTIASYERTLTDAQVNGLLDQVAEAAKTTFGTERL